MRNLTKVSFPAFCAILAWGCSRSSPPGFKEQNVPVASQTVKQYVALFSVDRQNMWFPPLPTNGTVRILTVDRTNWKLEYPPPNYDVSFQFYGGTGFYPYWSRFVALKSNGGAFKPVSEQLTFSGPKRYMVDDSLINETIELLNETQQIGVIGTNIAGTVITYRGPDQRFRGNGRDVTGLKPSDIGPILRQWGYDYVVDKTGQDSPPNNAAAPKRD